MNMRTSMIVATLAVLFFAGAYAVYAAADSCADSDSGVASTIFGWASGISRNRAYNVSDACMNSTHLTEQYCSGTARASTTVSCITANTNACSSGKCVDTSSCTDSDSWNYMTTGNVSGNTLGTLFEYTDYCINGTHVMEHYCSGTGVGTYTFDCSNMNMTTSCSEGRCV